MPPRAAPARPPAAPGAVHVPRLPAAPRPSREPRLAARPAVAAGTATGTASGTAVRPARASAPGTGGRRARLAAALVALALAFALALASGAPAAAETRGQAGAPPARVVSVNLCTDQLAMLIAAPGQLVSVSDVARDPVASAMAAEASAYPTNHGTAEEVLLLAPDLVVASEFTPPATLDMARRLGLRVETFPIEASFEDARASIRRMGELLGREARAEELVRQLDAALAPPPPDTLADMPAGQRPRAALLYADAYSSGAGTLADAILAAAGLRNVATERGMVGMGRLPLELLALERPDFLVLGQDYGQPAVAQETLRHPVLRGLGAAQAAVADNLWVCGSPLLGQAVAELRTAAAPPTPTPTPTP